MSENSGDRYATLPSGPTICFRDIGDQADPAILLIAGLGEDLTSWTDSFVGSLVAQSFRVITMDNRDVGQSTFAATTAPRLWRQLVGRPRRDAYSLADMAKDCVGVLDHLGIARVHLVGRSMGGMIAQTVAATEPHRVQADALDEAVATVRSASAVRSALVARASATSRWIWLSGAATPDLHHVEKVVARAENVRAAVGRPGHGLDGFRSSHQDALAAQAMVIRLGSARNFTAYADVELIDSLTKDRAGAQRFVAKTLGPLAEADDALRQALLTYVQCGFNTTRAAAHLYAHRNTVERRVSRANELSVVKVEDNPTHVAAALLVLDFAPDILAATSAGAQQDQYPKPSL